MKKQHIITIFSILTVAIIIAVTLFFLLRPTVREWTGEDGAHNSVTTRGIFGITEHESNQVIAFADFTNGRESVFCSRPQCRHNSRDCFAFDLANTYRARHFAIMGEHIFFTSASYDPTRENRHVIEVFEASFTGGTVRSIAKIENNEQMTVLDSRMIDGYFILSIAVGGGSTDDKGYYAMIDLRTGDLWQIPVFDSGYNNSTAYYGMVNGNLLLHHSYLTQPQSNEEFMEMAVEIGRWQATLYFRQFLRVEIYVANFSERTLTICDRFTQTTTIFPDRMEHTNIFPAHGGMIISNVIEQEGVSTRANRLILIDSETQEETETTLPFDWPKNYKDFVFDFIDDTPALFCTNSNTYKKIYDLTRTLPNSDTHRFRHEFAVRLESNIIFFSDRAMGIESNSISFINAADLFESGTSQMRTINLSPDWGPAT